LDNSHGDGIAYEVPYTQRQKMAAGRVTDIKLASTFNPALQWEFHENLKLGCLINGYWHFPLAMGQQW
jgi:hypothetical protein